MFDRNAYISFDYEFISMKKRVAIFVPEIRDREEIGILLERYFRSNFKNYFSQIEFQKYSHLGEPIRDN